MMITLYSLLAAGILVCGIDLYVREAQRVRRTHVFLNRIKTQAQAAKDPFTLTGLRDAVIGHMRSCHHWLSEHKHAQEVVLLIDERLERFQRRRIRDIY